MVKFTASDMSGKYEIIGSKRGYTVSMARDGLGHKKLFPTLEEARAWAKRRGGTEESLYTDPI